MAAAPPRSPEPVSPSEHARVRRFSVPRRLKKIDEPLQRLRSVTSQHRIGRAEATTAVLEAESPPGGLGRRRQHLVAQPVTGWPDPLQQFERNRPPSVPPAIESLGSAPCHARPH